MSEPIERALITGASGFIGRAAVTLFDGPKAITAAVRNRGSFPASIRQCLIGEIGPHTRWEEALRDCQVVVHCAGRAHQVERQSPDSVALFRRINTLGTLRLAEQAKAAGIRRLVFISSIKVQGETSMPGRPFTEADQPAPVGGYAVSKAEAESGLLAQASQGGVEVVIIRPPLVYGPGVGANFSRMARWIAAGYPVPLGAVESNRRSLVGLDNLLDLIQVCLHHPAAANQIFLAGDGEDLSSANLIRRTAAALGVEARLVPVPVGLLRSAAALVGKGLAIERLVGSLQGSIAKARTTLGWNPPTAVDEGLRRAVQSIARRRNQP